MSVSVGAMSGFHSGMHGGSLVMLLGAWVILGVLVLIVKAIISSLYPESTNQSFETNSDSNNTNSDSSLGNKKINITKTRRPIIYPSGKIIAHDKRYA